MSTQIQTATMRERIEHLLAVISGERFLKMEGYNEVPFFICPYRPHESVEMERLQRQLINQLEQSGVQVLEVNLYDLSIEILKKEDDFQYYIGEEPSTSKTQFLENIQGILDVDGTLIPHIADLLNAASYQVLILTGVGEVYPYLRSHNILNNLQSTAKTHPTLMFFPGEYTHSLERGASLDLFAPARKLADEADKYYRAYNIYEFEA